MSSACLEKGSVAFIKWLPLGLLNVGYMYYGMRSLKGVGRMGRRVHDDANSASYRR
jgi:hypothetical protein